MKFLDKWFRRKKQSENRMGIYGPISKRMYGDVDGIDYRPNGDVQRTGDSVSVSLSDLGVTVEDFMPRPIQLKGGYTYAASGYQLPEGADVPREELPASEKIRTLIIQSGQNQRASPPPLESVQTRQQRAQAALRYYLTDSIAGPAVKTLYQFVIGAGFDVEFDYNFEAPPPWFDANKPEVAAVKSKFAQEQKALGNTSGGPGKQSHDRDLQIFRAYLKHRIEELIEGLGLEDVAVEMARDALVFGDSFHYRVDTVEDESYVDNFTPTEEFLNNTVLEVQGLNPLAILLEVDQFNTVTKATIEPQSTGGGGGGENAVTIPDLTKLIRLKWGGSSYSIYGVSHLVNALDELNLKASLMRAHKAGADRFAVPIRLAKYGVMMPGNEGGPIAPLAWRTEMVNAFTTFNPETDTMVAPFHWSVELVGTENGVEDLSDAIAESDRRIMMALGIPPNFLDSNFTSFATAKIQFSNTILKLRELQRKTARALEEGILRPWAEMRGYRNLDGSILNFKVRWHRGELESDPAILALIGILAGADGQQLLSRRSMRETMGFSSETEDQWLAIETEADRIRSEALGIPLPGQEPVDPLADPNAPPGEKGSGPPGAQKQNPGQQQQQPNQPKGPKKKGVNTNPTKVNN